MVFTAHTKKLSENKKMLTGYIKVTWLVNKSAKWHCGRHTLICKKILIKKT